MTNDQLKNAFHTMLTLQNRINSCVHNDWVTQDFAWYRAIWVECGELMEHIGYKWWKKHTPDEGQIRLEAIDIWHFGLSSLFQPGKAMATIANEMTQTLDDYCYQQQDARTATEAIAAYALQHKTFSVPLFWDLLHAVAMSFDELYQHYVGKNVLNVFRQDNGYRLGDYRKQWQGREDNEHLAELLNQLDSQSPRFSDDLYNALERRYHESRSDNSQ